MLVMADYWYWIVMAAPAVAMQLWKRIPLRQTALWAGTALAWFVAFEITGDRRMFFPFSMQLAAVAWALSPAAGILMAWLFLAVRILQNASFSVLAVEVAVVCVALGCTAWMRKRFGVWQSVLGCALLAFAGLAVN